MPRSNKAKKNLKKSNQRKVKTPTKVKKNLNTEHVVARCMKCREQKTMNNAKLVVLKNGRNAMKGTCVCGTKMFKFV
jgi:hypothetical protein